MNIIKNRKYLNKFCERRDKLFNCRKVYGCNVSCPLWHLIETQRLMDLKNLSLGEAFRISIRKGIPKIRARKLFEEVFGANFDEIQSVMNEDD